MLTRRDIEYVLPQRQNEDREYFDIYTSIKDDPDGKINIRDNRYFITQSEEEMDRLRRRRLREEQQLRNQILQRTIRLEREERNRQYANEVVSRLDELQRRRYVTINDIGVEMIVTSINNRRRQNLEEILRDFEWLIPENQIDYYISYVLTGNYPNRCSIL